MRYITSIACGYRVRFIQNNSRTNNHDVIAQKIFPAEDYIDGRDEALHWARQWRDDFEREYPEFTDKPRTTMPWRVYIVRCADGSLYTGITTDIVKRITAHNTGNGARYTRSRRPVALVYIEPAETRSAAARREFAIKRMSVAGKLGLAGRPYPM